MPVDSLVNALIILGQLQGLLIASALLAGAARVADERRRAALWLVALLLCVVLALFVPVLQQFGQIGRWPRGVILLSGLPLLFGPLLLAHVAAQTGQLSWLRWRWLALHAIPLLVFLLLVLPLFGRSDDDLRELLVLQPDPSRRFSWLPTLKHASFVVYAVTALGLLRRYQRRLREQLADIEPYRLRWLRALVWSALLLALSLALAWITGWSDQRHDLLLSLLLCLLMLATGFHGLQRSPVFVGGEPPAAGPPVPDDSAAADGAAEPATRPLLAGEALQDLRQRLEALATQEALLHDHDLTLDRLAAALRVSPHQLSWTLNQVLGRPFYDFINGLRVESVKRRLRDPALSNTPILDIALGCGFANKTTFNKAFKACTGMTPSAWRRQQRGSSVSRDPA